MVRQNHVGPEHYLLALLAQPSLATEVLSELGLTYERLRGKLDELKTVNGRRRRYRASGWTTVNPAAYETAGWANGFAAASGRPRPNPQDWLLAIVYQDPGFVASILAGLGVSTHAIVDRLRLRGVAVPEHEVPLYRPWRGHREVEVARAEWQAVVDLLSERHPPGSEWRWGFNSRRDRPGRIQFSSEEDIDLLTIVAEATTTGSRAS